MCDKHECDDKPLQTGHNVRKINLIDINFDDMTISPGFSKEYTINTEGLNGLASLHVEIFGHGTLQVRMEASNDGVNYNIVDGFSPTITPKHLWHEIFQLPFAKYVKFVFTETSGTDAVTIKDIILLTE